MTRTLAADDPLAIEVSAAVATGDVAAMQGLLARHPELAMARVRARDCEDARTLLHLVADWPGHRPRGAEMVAAIVAAGADVNARGAGRVAETPLHWAASSDDVAVLDALLDAGADIEADGAVIAGGTALDDAVAFGQWNAARRLAARGAKVRLQTAAALGLTERVEALAEGATAEELSAGLWYACHGGCREAAEILIARGAARDWVAPWDATTPLDAAVREGAEDVAAWLRGVGARSARELAEA